MPFRLPIVFFILLGLAPVASAQPLDPVAPASGVVILEQPAGAQEQPAGDQDEPRMLLARADDPAPAPGAKPGSPAPASPPAASPRADPFAKLKVVVPKDKLPPVRSVRATAGKAGKSTGERKNITVTVGSTPSGASVHHGGKNLGVTPVSVSAPEGSTPMDIVLRARSRMTLRTRILRDTSRSYYYKLHPAKFR